MKAKVYTTSENMTDLLKLADVYFGDYVFHGGDQGVMFMFECDTTEKSMTYVVEDFAADVMALNGRADYKVEEVLC